MKKIACMVMGGALFFSIPVMAACSSKKAETAATTEAPATREEITTKQINQLPAERADMAAWFMDESNRGANAAEGYVVSPSGLEYYRLAEGNGRTPTATSTVNVHYTGYLTDGTVFDSSELRGEPISFPLSGVIPGWTEGLQYMQEGERAVFYIPSELAYGQRGVPGAIPPNADLIFEVQLLKIEQ